MNKKKPHKKSNFRLDNKTSYQLNIINFELIERKIMGQEFQYDV